MLDASAAGAGAGGVYAVGLLGAAPETGPEFWLKSCFDSVTSPAAAATAATSSGNRSDAIRSFGTNAPLNRRPLRCSAFDSGRSYDVSEELNGAASGGRRNPRRSNFSPPARPRLDRPDQSSALMRSPFSGTRHGVELSPREISNSTHRRICARSSSARSSS